MTAKQYLNQAIFLRNMIRRTETQLEEIHTRAEGIGAIRYDKISVQSSPKNALEAFVIQMERAERTQMELIGNYYSTYATIQAQISSIEPEIYRQVLSLRYLDGLRLDRISDLLDYSDSYIRHIHGRALQAFDRKFHISGRSQ